MPPVARKRTWIVSVATLGAAAAVLLLLQSTTRSGRNAARSSPPPPAAAAYVGQAACRGCHEKEAALWAASHHALAMQEAGEKTVLGDFSGASFTYHGVTTTFSREGGEFRVSTDGPDGKIHEYRAAFTFGVSPLQQYLIPFPGGRYQALNVCWDSRPGSEGGQRWFHLYPGENVSSSHVFHWTGIYQNWNFMCSECHSTNVRKGYGEAAKTYETTWSEIDVSCEACHGPGSAHAAWARTKDTADPSKGLVVRLAEGKPATWTFDSATGIARRSVPRTDRTEIETCARCHSRRAIVSEDYVFGRPLLDTHRPELLDGEFFYADGQILEEDYEYQSFLQSRMYAEGVTCTDCHNPHGLALAGSPDDACARCHLAERYAAPAHHFHKPGSPGASCVACHMPSKTYMVVHRRHDHGFRVPRPDLTVKIGVPSPCTSCHRDRSAKWAAEAALKWWGPKRPSTSHYGEALHAGRESLAGAPAALAALAAEGSSPAIVRASALRLLSRYTGASAPQVLREALSSADPLLRFAAVTSAYRIESRERVAILVSLLEDPVRTVRMEAARALASVPADQFPPDRRAAMKAALDEYRRAQDLNADRPESHLNLGTLALEEGNAAGAEAEYRKALALEPRFPATYVNLADLYRAQGRDGEGEKVLREGLGTAADTGDIECAYGLLLVRTGRAADAIPHFERAAAQRPADPHYAYVYGVALNSSGQGRRALEVLGKAAGRHTGDAELLAALATINRDRGSRAEAVAWARKLAAAFPEDTAARQLLASLEGALR